MPPTRGPSRATATTATDSGTVADEIDKADATIVVTGYSVTYDGAPQGDGYGDRCGRRRLE